MMQFNSSKCSTRIGDIFVTIGTYNNGNVLVIRQLRLQQDKRIECNTNK